LSRPFFFAVPAQLIALAAALSYAVSGIAAKRGLRYSTPITVTLVSAAIHGTVLWIALLIFAVCRRCRGACFFCFYLAAVIGIVALPWLASATLLPGQKQKPVWDRRAMGPFVIAGSFETLGILLGILALSIGQVVVVSPIIATSPLWILLSSWLFLRDIERLTVRTVLGAACVVAGTIAISIVR
jgi:uncharacterized membrane protein